MDQIKTYASGKSIVEKTVHEVHNVDCQKVVMKVSYRGPQGPKGDTATFNDLDIPSLSARFLNGLL